MLRDATPLQPAAQELLARAQRQAAVIGNFRPKDLLGKLEREAASPDLDQQTLLEVLGRLSIDCEEVESGSERFWRMLPEARVGLLDELKEDENLHPVAQAAGDLAVDGFGAILVATALGQPTKMDGGIESLQALDSALGFLKEDDRRRDVQAQIQFGEIEEAFRFILPGDLIGRDEELQRLRDFVSGGGADHPVSPGDLFLVSGSGGSGKSALLTDLARHELAKGEGGVAGIWLDFDRPLLASTDPVQLMLEFARQLALLWPEHRAALLEFRKKFESIALRESQDAPSRDSSLSLAFSLWSETLQLTGPVERPVILVLDTFEEAISFGEWNADRVLRWIDGLTTEGGLPLLRPILSAREYDPEWRKLVAHRIWGERELKGLQPDAAEKLLEGFLRFSGAAPERFGLGALVERYGGNPLVLKILAKFLAEEGPEAEEDLLSDEGLEDFREELSQQYLYTRILARIRTQDKDLVALAFPGLALRRVTPDLIQQVLAEPCAIAPIDRNRAEELAEGLRRQVWLVEFDPNNAAVRHRRDLRRLMLQAIPPGKTETLREIHRRAANYYERGTDPQLSAAEQAVEARYHALMAGDGLGPLAEPDTATAFLDALGEDAATLPPKVHAELKFAAGRNLFESEAAELGDAERGEVESRKASFGAGVGYVPPDAGRKRRSPNASIDLEMAEAFARGEVEAMVDLAEEAIEWDFRRNVRRGPSPPADITVSPSWRAAMAALAMGSAVHFAGILSDCAQRMSSDGSIFEQFHTGQRSDLTKMEALAMLAVLVGSTTSADQLFRDSRMKPRFRIETPQTLRAVELLPTPAKAGPHYLSLQLVRSLDPETVEWLHGQLEVNQMMFAKDFSEWMDRVRSSEPMPLHAMLPSANWTVALDLDKDLRDLGRRCTVGELYAPIQYLAEIAPLGRVIECASAASRTAFAWPAELRDSQLADNLARDRKRWCATLVEFADRAGALEAIVESLAGGSHGNYQFVAMLQKYQTHLVWADNTTANRRHDDAS